MGRGGLEFLQYFHGHDDAARSGSGGNRLRRRMIP